MKISLQHTRYWAKLIYHYASVNHNYVFLLNKITFFATNVDDFGLVKT